MEVVTEKPSINTIPEGYKRTELGIIPEEWEEVKLGNIASTITKGTTPTTLGRSYVENGINFVKAESIDFNGRIDHSKVANIDQETHRVLGRSKLEKNDLLFSIAGVLGRVGRVRNEDLPANTNQALSIIRISNKKNIDLTFLFQYLKSDILRDWIDKINVSAAQANLSLTDIANIPISLPPTLEEQQAIADALSDVDALIAELDALIEKKQQVKKGAMQQLLTAKKRLPGFGGEWEEKKLGELFDISAGRDLDKSVFSQTERDDYKYPVYANSISNDGLYGYYNKYDYPAKSITVTARGTLGHANYRETKFSAIGRLLVLIPNYNISGKFISESINATINFAIESTGVPQLTAPQISQYKIKLPENIKEQKAIARILSDMDAEIQALQSKRSKYEKIKQGMMQELLTGKTRLV